MQNKEQFHIGPFILKMIFFPICSLSLKNGYHTLIRSEKVTQKKKRERERGQFGILES